MIQIHICYIPAFALFINIMWGFVFGLPERLFAYANSRPPLSEYDIFVYLRSALLVNFLCLRFFCARNSSYSSVWKWLVVCLRSALLVNSLCLTVPTQISYTELCIDAWNLFLQWWVNRENKINVYFENDYFYPFFFWGIFYNAYIFPFIPQRHNCSLLK